MDWDYEIDVAVVGGGACGLTTALRAAYTGAGPVAVFEKDASSLANADISSGSLAAGGTRWQREAGIDDSPDAHAADVLRKNHGEADEEIVRAICATAPRHVEWLADVVGVPTRLHAASRRIGHSAPRMHADPDRQGGKVLMGHLRRGAQEHAQVHFVDHTPGIGLVADDRAVRGVRVVENGVERRVGARAVVLACDGFGANRTMLAEHCPELADAPYIGVEGNTGEAIAWARDAGAALQHMAAYQGHGFVVAGHGTRLDPAIVIEGGIVVDRSGRRFMAEDIGYSEMAPALLALTENRALEIWDDGVMGRLPASELMRDSARAGAYESFATLEDLAARFDIAPADLVATVDAYNRAVDDGHDPLGRTALANRLSAPWYAAWITGGLAHTQGGVVVDRDGRALRTDGSVIDGLYAGGGTAAGLSGSGAQGYLSGNGLLAAVGFGYRIGDVLGASP